MALQNYLFIFDLPNCKKIEQIKKKGRTFVIVIVILENLGRSTSVNALVFILIRFVNGETQIFFTRNGEWRMENGFGVERDYIYANAARVIFLNV